MKHPVIKLAGLITIISGLVVLSQIRSSADYSVNSNSVSFFYFFGGIALILIGLVTLLYKHQSNYDIPDEKGRKSEGQAARDRKESGTVESMTMPGGGGAPLGDGHPAAPLEWWK